VGSLPEARSSNFESLENPNRMPTTVVAGIASHQAVMHPLTPTDDVFLRAKDGPPLDPPISSFVPFRPPQKQLPPLNSPPLVQLHSLVARPVPTPTLSSILPSPISFRP